MVQRVTHDTLTGVANRPLLVDHLRHGIAYGQRYDRMVATFVVNVDHFKYVNQSLGHDAGDELLKGVALRLRGALRDHDSVARLGADSFAMTLIDIENLGGAAQAMTRVLGAVREPFMIREQEVVVTCSVGCALYPNDGPDPETLLRRADTAMRHARTLGGDCYYFYSADSDRYTEERLYMEANLRRAVENGELLLQYQPQVNAKDGSVIGMEALVSGFDSGQRFDPGTPCHVGLHHLALRHRGASHRRRQHPLHARQPGGRRQPRCLPGPPAGASGAVLRSLRPG
jgi:diguanylate cyclase (GGDEF)-like protein